MSEEEKKQKVLDMWDKESLANEWVKEHIKYNYTKEDLDQAQEIIIELQQKIDKAIEYIKNNREIRTFYTPEQRWEVKEDFIKGYCELLEILGDKENE